MATERQRDLATALRGFNVPADEAHFRGAKAEMAPEGGDNWRDPNICAGREGATQQTHLMRKDENKELTKEVRDRRVKMFGRGSWKWQRPEEKMWPSWTT